MPRESNDGLGDEGRQTGSTPSKEGRTPSRSFRVTPLAVLYLISALLLAGLGLLLIQDQPGLRAEYFPLTKDWEGSPIYTDIGQPQVTGPEDLRPLVSKRIFSVRWRGWLNVGTSGDYLFVVRADQGGYLILNGERTTKRDYQVFLERGVHAVEVGFYQTRGNRRLVTRWKPPEGKLTLLPVERLHASRPVRLHQLLRDVMAPVPRPFRQLFGVLALLGALLLIRLGMRSQGVPSGKRIGDILDSSWQHPRILYAGFLAGLFILCWLWTSRFTAPLLGGDDPRYVYKALFPAKGDWFFFRYAHVYLLKVFIWLRDGDGFLGSRTYWSFMFSVTVTALALGCKALGPRWQLRTAAVTLFVLVSQSSILGLAGGAFSDYTTMMFVTLAVAVYLLALQAEPRRGKVLWHEVAIGAMTVAALKSKETGIILGWLPMLFLWTEGRIDLRGFARKIMNWAAGVAGAMLVLMSLDAWLLGDFWYSVTFEPGNVQRLHFRRETGIVVSVTRWTNVVFARFASAPGQALRYLWVLALAAPVVATLRRKRIEHRLLFLMPLAYLLLMVAVYTWAPHTFSKRHLYPILPMCALSVGAFFYWLGLEERPWKQLLSTRVLVPFVAGASALVLLINPSRAGILHPSSGVGTSGLWFGALLLVVAIVVLVVRRARPAWMLLLLLAMFGPGFVQVQESVAQRFLRQRGELILYPWEEFREEIEAAQPQTLALAPEIWKTYRMGGQRSMRRTIARIVYRRQDLVIPKANKDWSNADLAIAGPEAFREWTRNAPGLRTNAVFDASGRLALVRPGDARQGTSD